MVAARESRFKRFLLQMAANCAAAALAPLFLVMFNVRLGPGVLFRNFLFALVYANAIGFLASYTVPKLYPTVRRWGSFWEWALVVAALTGLAIVGCLIGSAFLIGFNAVLWFWFTRGFPMVSYGALVRNSWRICIFITLAFGLVTTVFSRLKGRLDRESLERERAQNLATEARLASLESRLHPHFLFNTLNSISSLIPVDPERAERLIEKMSALIRFSLDASAHGLVPLEQEMKIVGDYLDIEQARLGARLRYQVNWDAPGTLRVPPLAVQTLVENSIKHAIAPDRHGGEIRVQTSGGEEGLHITVSDTGPGFALDTVSSGHGLDNLQKRMAMLFHQAAGLRVSRREGWTDVHLVIPQE